jgi:hypothetical protein
MDGEREGRAIRRRWAEVASLGAAGNVTEQRLRRGVCLIVVRTRLDAVRQKRVPRRDASMTRTSRQGGATRRGACSIIINSASAVS